MTTIKAHCPCCGDVDLTSPQVRLVVCSVPAWSSYAFTCPRCRDEVRKPAAPEIVQLLITGGVVAERWIIPAEALEPHVGPVITANDVLDFTLALGQAEELASATGLAMLFDPEHPSAGRE